MITARPGIDENRRAVDAQEERERVGVAVGRERAVAQRPRHEEHFQFRAVVRPAFPEHAHVLAVVDAVFRKSRRRDLFGVPLVAFLYLLAFLRLGARYGEGQLGHVLVIIAVPRYEARGRGFVAVAYFTAERHYSPGPFQKERGFGDDVPGLFQKLLGKAGRGANEFQREGVVGESFLKVDAFRGKLQTGFI